MKGHLYVVFFRKKKMKNTLKKNYEFKNVLEKGKFYRGKYLVIYILKNNRDINITGIAVSKKAAGGSVQRNRIKRVIREGYRLLKDELQEGYDIVFLWNKNVSVEDCSYINVSKEMKKLFKKADFFKK